MVKETMAKAIFQSKLLGRKCKNDNYKNELVAIGCKHYIWHLKNSMFVFSVASDSEKIKKSTRLWN